MFVTMDIAHRYYHHATIYHIMKTYSSPHFYDVKLEVAQGCTGNMYFFFWPKIVTLQSVFDGFNVLCLQ